MKQKHGLIPRSWRAGGWLWVAWCIAPCLAGAADVRSVVVAKGQVFQQLGAGVVSLIDEEWRWDPALEFRAAVESFGAAGVVSAEVELPGGAVQPLVPESIGSEEWLYLPGFDTPRELDLDAPDGVYRVRAQTQNDGPKEWVLNLSGSAWPVAPRVTNFVAAQSINPSAPFTVQWTPMTGGTAGDYIGFSVVDAENDEFVYDSGPPGGGLDGTATQATIPANTLQAGRLYFGYLVFAKIVQSDTSYGLAVAGYYKALWLPLGTTKPSGQIPFGLSHSDPWPGSGGVERDAVLRFVFDSRWVEPIPVAPPVRWSGPAGFDPDKFTYLWDYEFPDFGNRVLLCRYNGTLPAGGRIDWTLDPSAIGDSNGFPMPEPISGWFETGADEPESPPDAMFAHVVKIKEFVQESATPAPTGLFGFEAGAEATARNRLRTSLGLSDATGVTFHMRGDDWGESEQIEFEAYYASKAELDARFGNGSYTLQVHGISDGILTLTPSLGPTDAYPPAPTIGNITAMQAVDPAAPLTIEFTPLPGRGPHTGLVMLEIEGDNGNEVFWLDDEEIPDDDRLVVPAGTLWPGRSYDAQLTFVRVIEWDDVSHPDLTVATGFLSETWFTIDTTGDPVMPRIVIERRPDQTVAMHLHGEPRRTYRMETTRDFSRWLPQSMVWLDDEGNGFIHDPDAWYLRDRFYRFREAPHYEWTQPRIDIGGTVWAANDRSAPLAGAVVGTTLDSQTTTTGPDGRFLLESGTPATGGGVHYTIQISHGGVLWQSYGPWEFGDCPRNQHFLPNGIVEVD